MTGRDEIRERAESTQQAASRVKPVALALQGGGAHGAFAWGVLDCLLEDGRLVVEGVSATSAGAMNAAVLAHGLLQGDREGARQALHDFWHEVAQTSALYSPFGPLPWTCCKSTCSSRARRRTAGLA